MTSEERAILHANLDQLIRAMKPSILPLVLLFVFIYVLNPGPALQNNFSSFIELGSFLLPLAFAGVRWIKANNIGEAGREALIRKLQAVDAKQYLLADKDPAAEFEAALPRSTRWLLTSLRTGKTRRAEYLPFLWPSLIERKSATHVVRPLLALLCFFVVMIALSLVERLLWPLDDHLVGTIGFGSMLVAFSMFVPENNVRREALTRYLVRELAGDQPEITRPAFVLSGQAEQVH